MSILIETFPKYAKRSLSSLFPKKSSLENLCSFLTPKEKFRLLCNSKELSSEFDSKIDDFFMPREYQERIKSYGNFFEDLFYQILLEMKRNSEKKEVKIKLYEFQNDMINYLKYLVKKFDKIIKVSLIQTNRTEMWKLDFISKLLLALDKNVHLVVSLNFSELKNNDFYELYVKASKAINIIEIIDIIYRLSENILINDFFKTVFNWTQIKKLIINSEVIDGKDNKVYKTKKYGYKLYNNAFIPNLVELDIRCNYTNVHLLEHFLYKCSHVKKMSIKNITFENTSYLNDNSVLKSFDNITDLKLSANYDNLNQLLCYFYPIFPKIKNFHMVIDDNKTEEYENNITASKDKSQLMRNKAYNKADDSNKEYIYNGNDFIGISRNLAEKKIYFTTGTIESLKNKSKNNTIDFSYEKEEPIEDVEYVNFNQSKIIATLSNLTQCESLTYEIKEQKALSNGSNTINELNNILEINKSHLHFLEINIYNDNDTIIGINQFISLIQKISECKELNTFIFGFYLTGKYAEIFNDYFKIGNNLNAIQLIHNTKLNVMKIINEHPNLININLELIMDEPDYTKQNYENYSFDLDVNRDWKEIELTNYPINIKTLDYLRSNKNIIYCLNACVNLTDMDDLSFNQIMKTFIN